MRIKILDLFSGIGGISLGPESTGGFEAAAFCEVDPFCRQVLRKNWLEVEIYEDVRTLSGTAFRGRIDMVAGGFPCQDISCAGKGAGLEGERSGLWNEMLRIIRECRPRWVLAENVPALRTRGADRVLSDLEEAGYTCWPLVVGAWAVGASHKRDRVWIVAHADCKRELQPQGSQCSQRGWVGNSSQTTEFPARPGEQHDWEEPRVINLTTQRALGAATDGLPSRLVRRRNRMIIKAAGNSVVPQVAAAIGRAILVADNESETK
jgi:DNA (cytosine-5)-methyltransferase 1